MRSGFSEDVVSSKLLTTHDGHLHDIARMTDGHAGSGDGYIKR